MGIETESFFKLPVFMFLLLVAHSAGLEILKKLCFLTFRSQTAHGGRFVVEKLLQPAVLAHEGFPFVVVFSNNVCQFHI